MASETAVRKDVGSGGGDRIDDHLLSALESTEDDVARYHLREALQLKIAERHHP